MKILKNRIRCRICGDTIESLHVHDFKYCSCGKVAVDGGLDYLKRSGEVDSYEELSVREFEVTWLKEYEILFNLAYEWEGDWLPESSMMASFSKDNPYLEAVDRAYKAIIGGEK